MSFSGSELFCLCLRMASRGKPACNGPRLGNLGFRSRRRRRSADQEAAEASVPSPGLISLNNGGQVPGRDHFLNLCQAFRDWLKPERNSKQEMIACLALEQFLLSRAQGERAVLQQKWEACGRDLESFVEDLDDGNLRPPGLVHVQMWGQEALFSENTPIGQVMAYFLEQHSAAAPTALTPGTPSQNPPDTPRPTAPGHAGEQGGNLSREDHRPPSLLILQGESLPGPTEGAVSWESPRSPRAASPGASAQEETLEETPEETREEILEETREEILEETLEILEETREDTREETMEETLKENRKPEGGSPGTTRKLYSCNRCPKVFKYLCRFRLHERRHNNERPFVCAECNKGFFQASELNVHLRTHKKEKRFHCQKCGWPFSHKTNLVAHERIHSGARPYECPRCRKTYRQSSTYHRHLRMHQRRDSASGASASGASASGASTSRASASGASTSGASASGASTSGASASPTSGASVSGASASRTSGASKFGDSMP
ncbi:unnamed protein product [Pipistrellus nathusii]|uniref:Zinc finger and SCAN domain-containing protein 4 n=1 Tax=Pipistrellus nathusii TaxID=59473 RepID=A0ABN9ZKX0_PIPNA